jgi:hypothetical protein
MAEHTTMTVRADLRERLEALAAAQNQSIDEVLENLLPPPPSGDNWALVLAKGMEEADIDWIDEPDAAERSREHFEQHLRDKWQRIENQNRGDTNAKDAG